MKITVVEAENKGWLPYVEVYLDGEKVEYCIEADDEEGYIICHVADEDGKLIEIDPGTGEPSYLATDRLEGKVEIRFKNSSKICEWCGVSDPPHEPGFCRSVMADQLDVCGRELDEAQQELERVRKALDPAISALARLDKSYYRVWRKDSGVGYVSGNIPVESLVTVVESVRNAIIGGK